jgi:hypothetical protein
MDLGIGQSPAVAASKERLTSIRGRLTGRRRRSDEPREGAA